MLYMQKNKQRFGKNNGSYKHGMKGTRFYVTWKGMKSRCYNKRESNYYNYGGRGIKLCKRWLDFNNFKNDMYDSYNDNLFIDRINNNGNYCKSNCKWSTRKEQNENKRNIVYITYKGITKKRLEWAREIGISNKNLKDRINKLKWPLSKALFTPLLSKNK